MTGKNQTPYWIPCPICKKQTEIKVYEDTVALNFPVCCSHCGGETLVDIVQLRMVSKSVGAE